MTLSINKGVAYSGTSIGTLLIPVIFGILIKEYGVRGTMLLTDKCQIKTSFSLILETYIQFFQVSSMLHIIGL